MTRHALLLCATLLAAAGCGGPDPLRFSVPAAPAAGERVAIRYGTVEIREVSLPAYAASEEIYVRGPDGALAASPELLWSDEPSRAMSLEMARYLAQITGAQVASEPWPFNDRAQAVVEIRVEEMLADAAGLFQLSGQYFVAPDASGGGRSGLFSLSAAYAPEGGAPAIAAARGQAVRDLAALIAREGLR